MADPRTRRITRRGFLRGAGAGLAALGTGTLLEACAPALAGSGAVPLPRPGHPVKWPVPSDNAAIASNQEPEKDATLQVYTWVAYINQDVVNSFAKKFKCKVQITTFNTMNEALSKLRSGLSYDVLVGATVDTLGQLIESKLVQPLNHSYIPNITQAWPDFSDPYEEAAADLGASQFQVMRRVLLPLLGPAIFASAVLVFSGVIDDFVLVDLLSSSAGNTPMSVIIYSTQHGGNGGPALNALGTIMLAMSLVIAVIGFLGYRWLTRGERGSRLDALTMIAASEG